MSLFRCGFTIQRRQTPEQPENSEDIESEQSVPACFPQKESTSLGDVEYNAVVSSVADIVTTKSSTASSSRKRGKYTHFSAEIRAKIGKYASENGNSKAICHFKKELPALKESTVRTFKQAYEKRLKEERRKGNTEAHIVAIPHDTRGRPPSLLELDSKLISLLKSIRSRGGVVNSCVVKATALALVNSNNISGLRGFEPKPTWVKSIYKRCNFTRRAGTTTRPPVPRGVFEECKLTFLTDISRAITQHKIPSELVLNADQTPSSYVSVGRMTMASRNSSSVPIKGLTDKRNITLTFVISLSGEFSPMQIIYQGKTSRSQPVGFKFPNGFAVSQNEKHYSNEAETLSLIDKVIKPFVERKKKELKLPLTQKALLIWDVFRGQKTEKVLSKLASLNIVVVSVPANMTHFFQPLDLTVNGEAKRFMKDKFTTWYSEEVQKQITPGNGDANGEVNVDLRLTALKPLHASWLVDLYNHLSSDIGRHHIAKGWEKAGIAQLLDESFSLPPEDPFEEIEGSIEIS